MFRHLQDVCAWYFQAGLDAAKTHDTSIKPLPDERGSVGNLGKFSLFRSIFVFLDPELVSAVLELAFSPGITDRTFQRMVDQQKL